MLLLYIIFNNDPDVIWTHNLLIWSQTRYLCATESLFYAWIVKCFLKNGYFLSVIWTYNPSHISFKNNAAIWSILKNLINLFSSKMCLFHKILGMKFDPDMIRTHNFLIWGQMRYGCVTESDTSTFFYIIKVKSMSYIFQRQCCQLKYFKRSCRFLLISMCVCVIKNVTFVNNN